MPANPNASGQGQGQGKKGKGNKRQASLVASFDATLLSAAGSHPVTGSGAPALADSVSTARGAVALVASFDALIDTATLLASGGPVSAGALEATLEDAGVAAALIHLSELFVVQSLDSLGIDVAGGPVVAAALVSTLGDARSNSFGVLSPSELVLNSVLDDASLDEAIGVIDVTASVNQALAAATLSAHSPFATRVVELTAALADTSLFVAGGPVATMHLSTILTAVDLIGGAQGTVGGSVVQRLEDVALATSAEEIAAAAAEIVLEDARAAAAGAVASVAALLAQLADVRTLAVPEPDATREDVIAREERMDLFTHRRTDEEVYA